VGFERESRKRSQDSESPIQCVESAGGAAGDMTTPQSRIEIYGPKSGLACHEPSVLTHLNLLALPTQSRKAYDSHQERAGAG
jgi:hypothetical protein